MYVFPSSATVAVKLYLPTLSAFVSLNVKSPSLFGVTVACVFKVSLIVSVTSLLKKFTPTSNLPVTLAPLP